MKFRFCIDPSLLEGIRRILPILGIEEGDGITVSAVQGDKIGVSLADGKAVVYYREKVQAFRGIGVLAENARKSDAFDITEDGHFSFISNMLDASRCAVPRVETVKRLLDYLAIMGYNSMMLYTEDTIEIKERPYFGHLRGRYTEEEIREIDDYAYGYGIEIIPCIECYAHMERYLIWAEAFPIKDTQNILLAREPKTFEFLDQLIGTVARLFRSRRIHIGMDEAHEMGRGKFLYKHGYVPPFEIFNEYMGELEKIINKHGLKPMMWSDMYFRVHSKSGNDYYDRDTVIPESTKQLIPENMTQVFWHYGETIFGDCDDYMLKKHIELQRPVIMATGAWSWAGHFPEFHLMEISNRKSLNACRKQGVRSAMLTVWCNDNAECETFSNLLSLSYFAELCYNPGATDGELRERFEASTGGDYELFYKTSYYHNDFENSTEFVHRDHRFFGKQLCWQDPLVGLYENALWKKPMSEHYAYAKEVFSGEHSGKWAYLYNYAYTVMDYLQKKTYIAERLVKAYKAGDRAALCEMADIHIPEMIEKCRALHKAHKAVWFKNNKAQGWQNMDVRYAGMAARFETLLELLSDYLDGKCDKIEELEDERLPLSYNAYITYQRAFTVNYR